jgi:hypothetical protein
MTLVYITNALIFISWAASGAYVCAYAMFAPWWRTVVGRSMIALGGAIFVISTLAVTSIIFGQDYSARPLVRLSVWLVTAGITIGLCFALYRAQLRKRK